MSGRQATVGAILSVILAACGAGMEPTPPPPVSPSPSLGPSPLATVIPTPTAVVSSATRVATPTPTPRAAPPKPSGVRYESETFSFCETGGEGLCEVAGFKHTVRWKGPRTKGVQIRVYGVTECLSDDPSGAIIDGWCLRESTANDIYGTLIDGLPAAGHIALPSSMLVLLAKGPASKGKVTWKTGFGDSAPEIYSIVVAAFDKAGQHSPFTIADSSHLCGLIDDMECPDDSTWPPGDGE